MGNRRGSEHDSSRITNESGGQTERGKHHGGSGDPTTGQSVAEQSPRPAQPAGDGPDRPPQRPRSLGMGVPFEFAQDDREPKPLGQPGEFFLDQRGQVRVGIVRREGREGIELLRGCYRDTGGSLAEFQSGVHRHPVQPRPHAHAANRAGLPGQDEKRGLERILDVGFAPEDTATSGPDGIGVPKDQQLKCDVVAVPSEAPEQFPVGNVVPYRKGGRKQAEEEPSGHVRVRTG